MKKTRDSKLHSYQGDKFPPLSLPSIPPNNLKHLNFSINFHFS